MNNIQKINDIKYLIMENYSDKEPLNEAQKASKQCFFNYCDDIKKDLKRLKYFEDAIGCPLEVYFKMCVFGTTLYTTKYGNPEEPQKFKKYIYNHVYRAFCLRIQDILTPIYFTVEYGRAWAITREELKWKTQ